MNAKLFDIDSWNRKAQYRFFMDYDMPFFNITTKVECSGIFDYAKKNNLSLFLCYLYTSLKAANEIEEFRLRIRDNEVVIFDSVDAGTVVFREDKSFGFAYIKYDNNFSKFYESATKIIDEVKKSSDLIPSEENDNVIHYSILPWIEFTSLQHPRKLGVVDSIPKITLGKIVSENGKFFMPVNIEANHALMDGYHTSQYFNRFEQLLLNPF